MKQLSQSIFGLYSEKGKITDDQWYIDSKGAKVLLDRPWTNQDKIDSEEKIHPELRLNRLEREKTKLII